MSRLASNMLYWLACSKLDMSGGARWVNFECARDAAARIIAGSY
jgi:hypothetical protein